MSMTSASLLKIPLLFSLCLWLLSPSSHGAPVQRVLYIGDSLSVGPFGEALEDSLVKAMGRSHVWVYASCGSSVQHWIASEPVFMTPCGYRETTPDRRIFEDFHNGKKPRAMPTPKIEPLLKSVRPEVIIVQLGTNHFDTLEAHGKEVLPDQEAIFERFAEALRHAPGGLRHVIWISPPDSARYPDWIQSAVAKLIRKTAIRHGYELIDSRALTRYVRGKTGSDGVHYNRLPALDWEEQVVEQINHILRSR